MRAHTPAGRLRPNLSAEALLARHELCEDLAHMLCDTAKMRLSELGLAQSDVLHTIGNGLPDTGLDLSTSEAEWIVGRLAELLGWLDDRGQPLR